MFVWVVYYNTMYDGKFSSAGVQGVYSCEERAEHVASYTRDVCTEVNVEKFEVA